MKKSLLLLALLSCLTACSQRRGYDDSQSEEFTLGYVQRKIYKGMPQTEVAQALGSPKYCYPR